MQGPQTSPAQRSHDLLLATCAVLQLPPRDRPTAAERLEDALGPQLARMIVSTLARPPDVRGPSLG